MIATLFSTIPQPHRPIILDVRPMLHAWVDNIDNVHFGGASTDIVVRCLLHVILHWYELYSNGSRGWLRQRSRTRTPNYFDTAAVLQRTTRTADGHWQGHQQHPSREVSKRAHYAY